MKELAGAPSGCAQKLLTISDTSLEVIPRASSASCSLEPMPISDCLLCSISFRPLPSLPLAKRLETFISSWHNIVRHMPACSSVNVTSPLILEAPFGKGGPCQAAIIRHPTVSTDRAHKVGAQSLPWPPSFVTLPFSGVVAALVPLVRVLHSTHKASCLQLARWAP